MTCTEKTLRVTNISDALCTVLQVVNHLQDCGEDRRDLDRVYMIGDWMAAEGAVIEDLDRTALTAPMRKVVDQMLDKCEALMVDARALPAALRSRSLAMESAVIVNLADRTDYLVAGGGPAGDAGLAEAYRLPCRRRARRSCRFHLRRQNTKN